MTRLRLSLVVAALTWLLDPPAARAQGPYDCTFLGVTKICAGSGTPEGNLIGSVGDLFLRRDGAAGTIVYEKATGTGTTTLWRPQVVAAPTDATYITQTANGTLTNEQATGALASALLVNTTTTGVLSAYAGSSCTNQFVRGLSALGVSTCATVSLTTDVTGTLAAANGGTGLNTSAVSGVVSVHAGTWTINNVLTDTWLLRAGPSNTVTASGALLFAGGTLDVNGNVQIPITSSTVGQIRQNGGTILHTFGPANLFIGPASGNLTLSGASDNTGIGSNALDALTSGDNNVGLGTNAGSGITSGIRNMFVGAGAGGSITTTSQNVAIGHEALSSAGASDSIAIGTGALFNVSSANNIGIGTQVLTAAAGAGNTVIGTQTGTAITGEGNVLLGRSAGQGNTAGSAQLTSGSYTTLIGWQAEVGTNSLQYATAIGAGAVVNASNAIVLGGAGTYAANVGMGTTSPGLKLVINGAVGFTASASGAGVLAWSSTPPTIASGFCTSPVIASANGTAKFTITIGTGCAGSTGTLTMPAASTDWACTFANVTTPGTNNPKLTGGTTTTVTVQNFSQTTGVAANWTAGESIRVLCTGG